MPNFEYRALDAQGTESTGAIQAEDENDAVAQLRRNGLFPTQVVEQGKGTLSGGSSGGRRARAAARTKGKSSVGGGKGGGRINSKTLMLFTRQLATLIDSGLPLLRGLTVLAKQEPNPVLKKTVNQLSESVQAGGTFSEALAQHPRIFNKLYVNMVKAGELGGVLELVLSRLADYQEKAQKLKNKIVSAMIYPLIVMFIAVGIMVFLLLFIVPRFEQIFEEMLGGSELPMITQIVTGASKFVQNNWLLLFGGIALAIVGFKLYANTKGGRHNVDRLKLRMPVIGDIQRKSAIARFSRTLGTLVTSGVPILQALNITKETAGNVIISEAIGKVHDAVKEGESIVQPLEASKVFPPMVISMVDVGEETGQLPDMLLKIADVYDDEVDNAVSAMTSLLEPLMIVFLAIIVGTIVLALFMPLLDIISKMSSQ
jgi:type IV pilus assembly protein PilC